MDLKFAIETVVTAKTHFKVGELCDICDVINGETEGIELKGQTVVGEVVVINLVECKIKNYPCMSRQIAEATTHGQKFIFDCRATQKLSGITSINTLVLEVRIILPRNVLVPQRNLR